jgi:hypothetical protein
MLDLKGDLTARREFFVAIEAVLLLHQASLLPNTLLS